MEPIYIYKGRTAILPVSLWFDASSDTFTSEIRKEKNRASDLIATWTVTFLTDGTDGELILTLDNDLTDVIPEQIGYMDIKRLTGGEPVPVFDEVMEVIFKETITV